MRLTGIPRLLAEKLAQPAIARRYWAGDRRNNRTVLEDTARVRKAVFAVSRNPGNSVGTDRTLAASETEQLGRAEESSAYWDVRERETAIGRVQVLTEKEKKAYLLASLLACAIVAAARYQTSWPAVWRSPIPAHTLLVIMMAWTCLSLGYLRPRGRGEIWALFLQAVLAVAVVPPAGRTLTLNLILLGIVFFRAFVRLPVWDCVLFALPTGLVFLAGYFALYIKPGYLPQTPGLEWAITGGGAVLLGWAGLSYRWALNHRVTDKETLSRAHAVASDLFDANIFLQDRVDQAMAAATRQERLSLARELHDTVAYTFTTIAAGIETGAALLQRDPEAAERELAYARKLTTEGLREVRGIVRVLREKSERGFRGPERWTALANVFHEATGVTVTMEIPPGFPQVVDELDEVVYRLIQEGMINAYRHGRATVVWIRIWIERDHLCVMLSDNGAGAKEMGSGFGLLGMQERVHGLGGRLSWRTSPGAGFDLAAEIPLKERKPGANDSGAAGG